MFEKRKSTYCYHVRKHYYIRRNWFDNSFEVCIREYEDYNWGVNAQQISTQNERSQADLLMYDEDAIYYGIHARPKRNRVNIPSRWDDKRVAAWDYRKSWKHYSKREKQWKYK